MHDEDNKYGLRVTNLRGDKWIAYGDGMLLEGKSRDNLRIVVKAVQISVDQVYEAYSYPTKALDPSMVTELIPFIRDFKIGHYGRLGRLDAYTGGLGP